MKLNYADLNKQTEDKKKYLTSGELCKNIENSALDLTNANDAPEYVPDKKHFISISLILFISIYE